MAVTASPAKPSLRLRQVITDRIVNLMWILVCECANKGFKGRETAEKNTINYDISDLGVCETSHKVVLRENLD